MELHLPYVEPGKEYRPVVDRPDAVVDLLETDPLGTWAR
jgi:hypothetical protein